MKKIIWLFLLMVLLVLFAQDSSKIDFTKKATSTQLKTDSLAQTKQVQLLPKRRKKKEQIGISGYPG